MTLHDRLKTNDEFRRGYFLGFFGGEEAGDGLHGAALAGWRAAMERRS